MEIGEYRKDLIEPRIGADRVDHIKELLVDIENFIHR